MDGLLRQERWPTDRGVLNVMLSGPEDAPLIVFLHGVARRWRTFVPLYSGLSPSFRVLAIDFPGHGGSDRSVGCYRVVDHAHAAIALLRRHCRERFAVYGHSLGAMVAAQVAAEMPSSVHAAILEDPPFRTMGPDISETAWHGYFAGLQQFMTESRVQSKTLAECTRALSDLAIPGPTNGKLARLGDVRDPAAIAFLASCLDQTDPDVLSPIVEGRWLDGHEFERIAATVAVPVLLLQADPSAGGMLTERDARAFAAASAKTTRIGFPRAGHTLHVERTRDVLEATTQFLSALAATRGNR